LGDCYGCGQDPNVANPVPSIEPLTPTAIRLYRDVVYGSRNRPTIVAQ